jgi:hypothetical protein
MVIRWQSKAASLRLEGDDRPIDGTWEADRTSDLGNGALAETRRGPGPREALAKKYPILQGRLVPLAHRLRHFDTVHYELSASDPTGPRTGSGE